MNIINKYVKTYGNFDLGTATNELQFVNKLSISDYRNLWKACHDLVEIIEYDELYDYGPLKIIQKYPWCFKNIPFEPLLIYGINAVF